MFEYNRAQALGLLGGRREEATALYEQYLKRPSEKTAANAKAMLEQLRGPGKTGDKAADTAAAKKAFDRAKAAYAANRFGEAYDYFTQAGELFEEPVFEYNRAQALRLLGGRRKRRSLCTSSTSSIRTRRPLPMPGPGSPSCAGRARPATKPSTQRRRRRRSIAPRRRTRRSVSARHTTTSRWPASCSIRPCSCSIGRRCCACWAVAGKRRSPSSSSTWRSRTRRASTSPRRCSRS